MHAVELPAEVIESKLRSVYQHSAPGYRRDDEIEVYTDHHCWIWKTLSDLSGSFGRTIAALDVGCGSGRYFHCLKNVWRLVGVDISPEMLAAARHPVRESLICTRKIELICKSLRTVSFPEGSFDFIYSLGMFGYGCSIDVSVVNKLHGWLAPDGLLFFDMTDVASLSANARLRRTIKACMRSFLPGRLQRILFHHVDYLPLYAATRSQLLSLMRSSSFADFRVHPRLRSSPCWGDRRLECVAAKSAFDNELAEGLKFRVSGGCRR